MANLQGLPKVQEPGSQTARVGFRKCKGWSLKSGRLDQKRMGIKSKLLIPLNFSGGKQGTSFVIMKPLKQGHSLAALQDDPVGDVRSSKGLKNRP